MSMQDWLDETDRFLTNNVERCWRAKAMSLLPEKQQ